MRSVSSIQNFLKTVRKAQAVLLVGGDTYDYKNNLGNSVSFVPTGYAKTALFSQVASDGILTDLNNDGIADIPVGRWPVRTDDELAVIVDRSMVYEKQVKKENLRALTLGEKGYFTYLLQAQDALREIADSELLSVDQIIGKLYPVTDEDGADYTPPPASAENEALAILRESFKVALLEGVDIVSYGGHASATQWGRSKPVLRASELTDFELKKPIGLLMLACYTTDFTNPSENTFVHQWMFGHESVSQGAAFIAGASTLSGSSGNIAILKGIAKSGSLAENLVETALALKDNVLVRDTVKTWNYLGDPTLSF